ncbi:MAG: carbon-nitrogen hydrolase family protein [Opitutae bacterium]|nr:carbon-nitrogen hydrolase family protein [Opitutae bacterium]
MKVASIQIPNSANAKNNLKAIEKGLALAAESRADLALFPECALTGFAARSDWSEDLMQHAFGKALKLCKKYRIGAVIPTSIRQNNSFYNGSIVVDTEGELIEVLCKRGLTSAEEAFFSVPQKKKRVFSFQGFRFALIFCREIEDAKELLGQESLDAILWPGYWGWDEDWEWDDKEPWTRLLQEVASFCQYPIIQANFLGDNAIKNSDGSTLGGSVAVSEKGELIDRSRPNQATPLFLTLNRIAEKSKKTE